MSTEIFCLSELEHISTVKCLHDFNDVDLLLLMYMQYFWLLSVRLSE